ncbi:MAG: flagellar hook-length control protein FliK [Acidobacteriota bacterium]
MIVQTGPSPSAGVPPTAALSGPLPVPAADAATPAAPTTRFDQAMQLAFIDTTGPLGEPALPTAPSTPPHLGDTLTPAADDTQEGAGPEIAAQLALPIAPILQPLPLVGIAVPMLPMLPLQAQPAQQDGATTRSADKSLLQAGALPARLASLAGLASNDSHPAARLSANDRQAMDTAAITPGASAANDATALAWSDAMASLREPGSALAARARAPLALPPRAPDQWREPLLNTLGERVQWQIQRGSEQAVIRLEPRHLGQVDIVIRHESGQMQVHLSASHHEVAQQLQGLSDSLRNELSLRHASDVNVQVSDHSHPSQPGQGQRRDQPEQPARQPGRALSDAADGALASDGFSLTTDPSGTP